MLVGSAHAVLKLNAQCVEYYRVSRSKRSNEKAYPS
jgi:hypothetical protein